MGRAAGRRGPGHRRRRGRPDRGRKPEAQTATAGQSAGAYGVPAYYVALITAQPRSDVENDLASSSWTDTAAELRSTQTGAVLAKITPPKPYVSFTGVTAAADDRTFVVSAQGPLHSSWACRPTPPSACSCCASTRRPRTAPG